MLGALLRQKRKHNLYCPFPTDRPTNRKHRKSLVVFLLVFVMNVVFWIFTVGNIRAFWKKSSHDSQHRLRMSFHKTDELTIECVRRQQPHGLFSASHVGRNYIGQICIIILPSIAMAWSELNGVFQKKH